MCAKKWTTWTAIFLLWRHGGWIWRRWYLGNTGWKQRQFLTTFSASVGARDPTMCTSISTCQSSPGRSLQWVCQHYGLSCLHCWQGQPCSGFWCAKCATREETGLWTMDPPMVQFSRASWLSSFWCTPTTMDNDYFDTETRCGLGGLWGPSWMWQTAPGYLSFWEANLYVKMKRI